MKPAAESLQQLHDDEHIRQGEDISQLFEAGGIICFARSAAEMLMWMLEWLTTGLRLGLANRGTRGVPVPASLSGLQQLHLPSYWSVLPSGFEHLSSL